MLLALALVATAQAQAFDFYALGPYDKAVPRPDALLGYGPGERHTTYHDQDRVVNAIVDAAKARVKRFDYGKSTEGRTLRILAVSSPDNIKRLDEILKYNQDLADGKVAPAAIKQGTPVVVWINECIHGNESASFESGMWLAYTLAASQNKQVTDLLDRAVVVVNPSYNPDGHERFVVWYNSVARGDKSDLAVEHAEGGYTNGRGNHYRFDLNRDRVAMSQLESRQETAEFRKWNPQVYVDQHGEVGTYFFPPVAQSIHKDIGRERYIEGSTILGQETAKAFDEHGWRYFVRETFDFYGAVYLDTWSSFNGAIGMTHETDGGGSIASERGDHTVVTLLDGMEKHFTSALAVLRAATANKDKFLQEFAQYKQDAVTGKGLGDQRMIAVKGDPRALARYTALLDAQGVKFQVARTDTAFSATPFGATDSQDTEFPQGSVFVNLAQPRGALASALLAPGQDFEDDFTKRQIAIRDKLRDKDQYQNFDRPEFYDITGWSVPLASGLEAFWSNASSAVSAESPRTTVSAHTGGKVGWTIPYTDQEDALAVIALLQADVHVHVATKEMAVGGAVVKPGTFFVFRDRNEPGLDAKVAQILTKHTCMSKPLDTSFPSAGVVGPGSDSVGSLTKPQIAIVFGDQPNGTRFGSAWFVFEKVFGLPFTAIGQRVLAGDLSQFTAIVLPPGARPTAQLKEWVQNGGVAIALGNSAFIGADYIDLKQSKLKDDKDPTELPGAIFQASFNPRSPLAFGYNASRPLAVPLSGGTFYKKKEEGGDAVFFGDEPKVLSGWTWPDETDALKGIVWLHDQQLGGGHVVWFAEDPTDRAMWPGTYKMLLNAVLMGQEAR